VAVCFIRDTLVLLMMLPVSVAANQEISDVCSGVRRKFMGGGLVQGRMVVICIWCSLFVTSQFDVISMFPNQRFGEVC